MFSYNNMKVIKHLKKQSPEYRLKTFFKEMPLFTKILIPFILITSIILMIVDAKTTLSFYSIVDARPIAEIILFFIVALTDFQLEERKGSIFFFLSYLIKSAFLIAIVAIVQFIFADFAFFLVNDTSLPMMFCLMIGFREMIVNPHKNRYFLIDPFQIKNLFYPIFLCLILELIGLRLDILIPLIMGVLLQLLKLDKFLMFISKKMDEKIISEKVEKVGVLKTGCSELQLAEIDRVATNNSVVLEE